MEENQDAWMLFIRCQTQFKWSGGMAPLPVGLDYNAVKVVRDDIGIEASGEMWSKILVLESEYVDIKREQAERLTRGRS